MCDFPTVVCNLGSTKSSLCPFFLVKMPTKTCPFSVSNSFKIQKLLSVNCFLSANLCMRFIFPLHFHLATWVLLFSFSGQLSISRTPSTTLRLSFAQLLWGWTICKAHSSLALSLRLRHIVKKVVFNVQTNYWIKYCYNENQLRECAWLQELDESS